MTLSCITFGVATACLYLHYHPNTAVIASVASFLITVFTFPVLITDEK